MGIPDCFRVRQHNKSFIVDSWRPNHNRVQSVTAVERFCRDRVAVYPARGSHILLRLQQEDHISHRREPLPMHPNTGIECTFMLCIICIMHIKRIILYTTLIAPDTGAAAAISGGAAPPAAGAVAACAQQWSSSRAGDGASATGEGRTGSTRFP